MAGAITMRLFWRRGEHENGRDMFGRAARFQLPGRRHIVVPAMIGEKQMILLSMFLAAAAPAATVVATPPPTATAPTPATSDDGFQIGEATAAVVIAKLGRPNATQASSDGTTTIIYFSVRTHVKGASFVPIIGLFAGGATGKTDVKSFTFGADGLLKSFYSSNSTTTCGTMSGCH